MSIVIAILLFGFMIFFHELGHFATAKWAGVKVNEFSIGKTATAAFNAADEIAVAAFLEGKIGFTDIPKILEKTVEKEFSTGDSFEEVFETDKEARKFAASLVK